MLQVELCVVICMLTAPLGLAAIYQGYTTFLFSPFLACSLWLLILHLLTLIHHLYKFWKAGSVYIIALRVLFLLPIIILLGAGAMAVLSYSWLNVIAALIGAKILSLPILYIIRPSYAIMGIILFIQTSGCMLNIIQKQDHMIIPQFPTTPGITACLTLMFYRYHLGDIWDVSLRIRPSAQTKHTQMKQQKFRHKIINTLKQTIFQMFSKKNKSNSKNSNKLDKNTKLDSKI